MIRLHKATLKDAKTIMDIHTKAFNDEMNRVLGRDGGPPGYDTLEENEKIIKEFRTYKIVYKHETIGFFFLIPKSETEVSLESLCIYPKFQNLGLGYKTLEEMEKLHPEYIKWSLISMKGSDRIQHLYEKFGYKKTFEEEWFYGYEKIISKL